MGWDYRIVREKLGANYVFGIHEAYYTSGKTIPYSITEHSVKIEGDSLQDLQWTLDNMAKALTKPILECLTTENDKCSIVEVQEG